MTDEDLRAAAAKFAELDDDEQRLPAPPREKLLARSYLRAAVWGFDEMVRQRHVGVQFCDQRLVRSRQLAICLERLGNGACHRRDGNSARSRNVFRKSIACVRVGFGARAPFSTRARSGPMR